MLARFIRLTFPAFAIAATACAPATTPSGGVVPTSASPTPPPNSRGPYKVTEVVDGDTIKLDIAGKVETVRLIGVDTPETVHPNKPVQCFGPEAKYWLGTSVAGSSVWIFADPSQDERDRYGRLLAYVWVDGGAIVNQVAVANGYAREYTYKTPHAYQSQFRADQASAKSRRMGLWAACPDAEAWAAGNDDTSEAMNDSPAAAAASGTVPSAQPSNGAPLSGTGATPAPSPTAKPTEVAATTIPVTPTATADPGEIVAGDCGLDQVFVQGYTRKDGKFVRAYCRKKPS